MWLIHWMNENKKIIGKNCGLDKNFRISSMALLVRTINQGLFYDFSCNIYDKTYFVSCESQLEHYSL